MPYLLVFMCKLNLNKFVLVLLCLFFASFSQAETDKKLLVLVGIISGDGSIQYYKHVTRQSNWQNGGNNRLKSYIKENYQSTNFVDAWVNPNYCYVFYQKRKVDGKVYFYASTHEKTFESAKKSAQSKVEWGAEVLDVGCNDGDLSDVPLLDFPDSPFPVTAEVADFQQALSKLLKTKDNRYRCSEYGHKTFTIQQPIRGVFVLRSSTATRKIDGKELYGNRDNHKEIVSQFIEQITKAFNAVCNSGSDAKMHFSESVIKAIKESMRDTYQGCLKNEEETEASCRRFLRRATSQSIRD